jgi:methylglutaconyl-CoA hydratase
LTERDWQRIAVRADAGIATVTLNRPAKRNALDSLTVEELTAAVTELDVDGETRIIVLRGAGPDFCAGADLEQLERMASTADPLENLADAERLGDLFVRMRRAVHPIIAVVHGRAIAGGAGLATACDLILAAESAAFGYPEVHLGFVPAMVTALLRRAIGEKRIFEMIATGARFSATEARDLGLVARVYPDDRFEEMAATFLTGLASRSASALQLCKRLLYGLDGLSFEAAIARGAEINAIARATPDCQDGVRRFLERKG